MDFIAKAANILLKENGVIKIADFGVSGKLNFMATGRDARTTFVGTPSHIAPEVILGENYDCSADIWGLGITCLEMATGTAPYSEYNPMKILSDILNKPPPSLESCSLTPDQFKKYPKSFNSFLECCLVRVPSERSLSSNLLNHEFVTKFSRVLCISRSLKF